LKVRVCHDYLARCCVLILFRLCKFGCVCCVSLFLRCVSSRSDNCMPLILVTWKVLGIEAAMVGQMNFLLDSTSHLCQGTLCGCTSQSLPLHWSHVFLHYLHSTFASCSLSAGEDLVRVQMRSRAAFFTLKFCFEFCKDLRGQGSAGPLHIFQMVVCLSIPTETKLISNC
jgi:hypothetical protein